MTFAGVIPILPTPFHDDETLDLDSWRRLLEFMVGLGVDGVTILGVLGESNRLNDHEREQLIEAAVEAVRQRIPIIVGTSHSGHARCDLPLAQGAGPGSERGDGHACKRAGSERRSHSGALSPYREDIVSFRSCCRITPPLPRSIFPSILSCECCAQIPSIACVKEEAVPTAGKIRQLRDGAIDRRIAILTGLGALYAPFDLEAGSDGFNTGFAFPEILQAMVAAARGGDWQRVHAIYSRFAALIVFEQQPGLAIRKELFRRRGLLKSARVRHPGGTVSPPQSSQLDGLLGRTLADTDITRPISSDNVLLSPHTVGTARSASHLSQSPR